MPSTNELGLQRPGQHIPTHVKQLEVEVPLDPKGQRAEKKAIKREQRDAKRTKRERKDDGDGKKASHPNGDPSGPKASAKALISTQVAGRT